MREETVVLNYQLKSARGATAIDDLMTGISRKSAIRSEQDYYVACITDAASNAYA